MGFSGIINEKGMIEDALSDKKTCSKTIKVPLNENKTFYTKNGTKIFIIFKILAITLLFTLTVLKIIVIKIQEVNIISSIIFNIFNFTSMSTQINCPHCKNSFEIADALNQDFKNELREKMKAFQVQKEVEWKNKETLLANEKITWQEEQEAANKKFLQEQQKSQNTELELKLKQSKIESENRANLLKEIENKQLQLLKQNAELEEKQKRSDFETEKKLIEKTKEIETHFSKKQNELHDYKMKEYELQMDSMRKTISDLKQKSEQGSMQAQGEAQEIILEEVLTKNFMYDQVAEVKKGKEGADLNMTIINTNGDKCGLIVFESKKTKAWNNEWIEKLKHDMRNSQGDVAILVTQIFPKDMNKFGYKDGVWICSMQEVVGLTTAIRIGLVNLNNSNISQINRGEKMQMLYNYLSGNEFKMQIESIVEGFTNLRAGIDKERMQMEKNWNERAKQIEKVIINTSGLYGSIKGIDGGAIKTIDLLE